MKKALRRFRFIALVFVVIELLLVVAFGIFYYNNFYDIQDKITTPILYISISVIIFLNVVLVWSASIVFAKFRKKSDLRAADLIGGDIQEAYNFGMLGLVIVDDNNIVIWTNDLFKDRQIDIVDTNVYEWQPKLEEFQTLSNDSVIKLEINSRSYDVKFLSEAGLYIFKDNTEYEELFDHSKRQAVVVGIIMIDNYSDISGTTDDSNDIISKIRNTIFQYTKNFNVLIRRYRNDAYFVLCNYESLSLMQKDKFSLIEQIHHLGEKQDTPPTLSIGLAHNFPDVTKLNEMAENAIDIAMSRGGDQVVVSKYGEELQFYGGKFEAQENRSKVKDRVMADSVLSLIRNSSNVIIMGHVNLDMDALGSCLGMCAICEYCKKDSVIVYDPKLTESKTRGALTQAFSRDEVNRLTVTPNEALDKLKSNTLVVVCDVHKPSLTMAPKLLDKATKVMVIDHHRRSEEFIDSPVFSYIEPSSSSASEMIAELIHYSSANPRIIIPSAYATIMLSGIFMDSNFFKAKGCGTRAFEASMVLKEYGADNATADEYLKDEFEEYTLITKIISTLKTPYYGIVYCTADEDDIIEPATLAKVGNQCMQMRGVNACFVIGKISEKEVRISCRSDGTVNVQLIAEQLNGGGHFTMAAGTLKNVTISRVEENLLEVLNTYLNDARTTKEKN